MKRRANGDGSLVQRKDGRWMGRYYITRPDGVRERKQIIGKDRQVVAEKMREEMALADKGMPVLTDNRTVGEYIEYWLANIAAPRVRKYTLYTNDDFLHRVVIPEVGSIKLSALNKDHILQMLARLRARGKSLHMQKRAKQLLSAALNDAVKLEIIHRNVTKLVDTPKYKPKERTVWNKEQVNIFLDHMKAINHPKYPLFVFFFYYGPRCAEAIGLRRTDIDFMQDVIHIRQTMVRVGKEKDFNPPKTEAGNRDLPLLPIMREALIELFAKEEVYKDDLVFHGIRGNPIDRCSVLVAFKKISRELGLPVITLHDTRHTLGTLLKDSGVSPKDAQTILGHADISTTLQIYTHSGDESKKKAMNALAANLNS